ncbi:Uncharacterized protein APZ42_011094 [Daphnia magna]|uniref:Uncharacterized protein n=1 Tax=Daphnia magna TaxID=35525 RepID=A0A162T693_9CRUS|nr:Uncharacterized protein APZ42_011094 [Daphnia magna]
MMMMDLNRTSGCIPDLKTRAHELLYSFVFVFLRCRVCHLPRKILMKRVGIFLF